MVVSLSLRKTQIDCTGPSTMSLEIAGNICVKYLSQLVTASLKSVKSYSFDAIVPLLLLDYFEL